MIDLNLSSDYTATEVSQKMYEDNVFFWSKKVSNKYRFYMKIFGVSKHPKHEGYTQKTRSKPIGVYLSFREESKYIKTSFSLLSFYYI